MEKKIPPEIIDAIVEQINEMVNIPFLNEEQERMLFKLILSILIETFLKIKH